MIEGKNLILLIILVVSISLLGGVLGYHLDNKFEIIKQIMEPKETFLKDVNDSNLTEMINKCKKEKRIDKEHECMMVHVDRFFYYKVRNDNESISMKELMLNGGDCGNWAQFWKYVGEEFGYESKIERIKVNSSIAHTFTITTNEQGYCIIDQKNIKCIIYG